MGGNGGQQQQEKEAPEDSAKEQNEQLAAALSDGPLQCLGDNAACSVRTLLLHVSEMGPFVKIRMNVRTVLLIVRARVGAMH
jgi:hypothetical protein